MSSKKGLLHLSIDNELVEIAKASGMNLSGEFENWLKIRLNQNIQQKPAVDIELELAKHQAKIQELTRIKNETAEKDSQELERNEILDRIIDNRQKDIERLRAEGKHEVHIDGDDADLLFYNAVVISFQKRLHKDIDSNDAKMLIEQRMKERGL